MIKSAIILSLIFSTIICHDEFRFLEQKKTKVLHLTGSTNEFSTKVGIEDRLLIGIGSAPKYGLIPVLKEVDTEFLNALNLNDDMTSKNYLPQKVPDFILSPAGTYFFEFIPLKKGNTNLVFNMKQFGELNENPINLKVEITNESHANE